jgi:bifunctional DNA-binding transcriptional regulator/antitoxin component of YhaV-PrlF toxin-antitoxin module
MRATIDQAGRLVIPKQLRDHVGYGLRPCRIRPGVVEVTADGSGLRIEVPAEDALVERHGRLVIGGGGVHIDDEMVRSLRDAGQHPGRSDRCGARPPAGDA